jgi:hypothetical protein
MWLLSEDPHPMFWLVKIMTYVDCSSVFVSDAVVYFFFFLYHTAFKLFSLWHVGYLLDDFYDF